MKKSIIIKTFTVIFIFIYSLLNKFSCLFYENSSFESCYYSGIGFPEDKFSYWIKVLFLFSCLICIIIDFSIRKTNMFTIIKIYYIAVILYIFHDLFENWISISTTPIYLLVSFFSIILLLINLTAYRRD